MIYLHSRFSPASLRTNYVLRRVVPALWAALVFTAALLPRLYALGTFLTIDEVKWAEGAAQFLLALHSGELAQTYWHFFPGITISWGGALALWAACAPAADLAACANAQVADLGRTIGWLRLTPVGLTSLGLAGIYLLGRKLVEEKWALLAALLLAFDPFFLAHSRILNGDASLAMLMFLSLLAFLIFWQRESANGEWRTPKASVANPEPKVPWRESKGGEEYKARSGPSPTPYPLPATPYLLLSGGLAGLALLTKLPSPLLVVFIVGLGLAAMGLEWRRIGGAAIRRWLLRLVTWVGAVLVIFVIFWPAMWVAPVRTLQLLIRDSFEVGEVGAGHDAFYLGQVVEDPGPWFYPYAIAFRLTPIVVVGLFITLAWLVIQTLRYLRRSAPRIFTIHHSLFTIHNSQFTPSTVLLIILIYVVFIILMANTSPKKLDRYVMAVIPALIFAAAFGFVELSRRLLPRYQPPTLDGLVMLQLILALFAMPYYLTYYNPLLGGVGRAAARIPVGWGEGMEQAAFYLNSLPGAESLKVSSWYSDIFNPYFAGQRQSFSDDGRSQLAADYVVFYINQIQRQKPYPGLVDYFRAGQPVFTVATGPNGVLYRGAEKPAGAVAWVEVYKAPAAQSAGGAPRIEGVAQLLAYKATANGAVNGATGQAANDGPGGGTRNAAVTLFLRVLGPLPENRSLGVALVPAGSDQIPAWPAPLSAETRGVWREGNLVEWRASLPLPVETLPGAYRLRAALLAEDGQVVAEFPISEKDPAVMLAGLE